MPFKPLSTQTFSPGLQYIVYGENYKAPNVLQWTASVQHEFSHGWQLQVNYIGNKSTHSPYGYPLNRAVYIPGTWTGAGSCGALTVSPGTGKPCSSTGNSAKPVSPRSAQSDTGYGYSGGGSGAIAMISGSNASYNGLITTIEHRMSKSFNFMANHTWSHCISLLDNPGSFNTTAVENPDDIHMDYANCGFDHRHMFNSSIVAESNFKLSGWEGLAANHWEIAPIVRVASGAPINITTGLDNSLTYVNNDRPKHSYQEGIQRGASASERHAESFNPQPFRIFAERAWNVWQSRTQLVHGTQVRRRGCFIEPRFPDL